ncbi:hypothetical protein Hanom_Chr02g00129561 [Helianthus anomalus]
MSSLHPCNSSYVQYASYVYKCLHSCLVSHTHKRFIRMVKTEKDKDHDLKHNICSLLEETLEKAKPFAPIMPFLKESRIFKAITILCAPHEKIIREFWTNASLVGAELHSVVQKKQIIITEDLIRDDLEFKDGTTDQELLNEKQVKG